MTVAEPVMMLDVRGFSCPMPVLKAHHAIHRIPPGERLHVVSNDRTSLKDIPTWCRKTGHTLLETYQTLDDCHFIIRRRYRHHEATAPP